MIRTLLGLSVFSQTQVAVFGNPVPFYVEEIQYTTCQPHPFTMHVFYQPPGGRAGLIFDSVTDGLLGPRGWCFMIDSG
jgi:hypothetical protein